MSGDSVVRLPPDGTGKSVYTVELTKSISDNPTTVEMEVAAIANSEGIITDDFRATRRREEQRWFAAHDTRMAALAMHANDRFTTFDRRGSLERGSTR